MSYNTIIQYAPHIIVDYSKYKHILFIHSDVELTNFTSYCNDNTYPLVYQSNTSRESIHDFLTNFNSINRIAFAFHNPSIGRTYKNHIFLNMEPLFDINESTIDTTTNNFLFVKWLIHQFSLSNVDFLACNLLNYAEWKAYFESLQSIGNVIIGASDDNTGNIKYGGDWVMENTAESIKTIYFNETIGEYQYLLGVSDMIIEWTRQLATSNYDYINSIAIDSNNIVYITGTTYGNLDGYTNAGSGDAFLAKYDSAGTKQWLRLFGTNVYDSTDSIAIDSNNNLYIAGNTEGNLDGNIHAGGLRDVFLTKYNSTGTKLWTKLLGTTAMEVPYTVAIDSNNNVYITGITYGNLDGYTNAGSGTADAFLAKYDSTGTKLWSRQFGTTGHDIAYSVAIDSNNYVYISGYTAGNLDGETNAGLNDAFLAKYNSTGTKLWTKLLGTTQNDVAYSVAIDSNNYVYITGNTNGNLDGETNAGSGTADAFLAKYDSTGTKLWTKLLGTTAYDSAFSVAIDSNNNVYITGNTAGNLDGETNAGLYDVFLAKYNSTGTKLWTKLLHTTTTYDYSKSIAIDSNDNVYISLYTRGNLNGYTNAGLEDGYLLKLSAPAQSAPTIGTLTVPAKNFGDAPFNLSAPSSNSSGAFTYTSSDETVATVTSGGTVTIVGAGSTTITATQAADSNYTSGSVTGTLVVSSISPTIGTLTVPAKNFGDAQFNISAPSSNSSGAFTYTSSDETVATVTSGGTVNIVSAGSTTITATQAADGNYTSGSVTATLVVSTISLSSRQWEIIEDAITGINISDDGKISALNSDGTIIAVGAPQNSNNGLSQNGQVRIFIRDITNTTVIPIGWRQLGNSINGSSTNDWFGMEVALNAVGDRVVIGATVNYGATGSGYVRAYQYSSSNDNWLQIGQTIPGERTNDHSGRTVAISDVGDIIAIGAQFNSDSAANAGHVRVYNYNIGSNSWVQLGGDIDGESSGDYTGGSISLSSDGHTIAIGSYSAGTFTGHTRVYKYDATKTTIITNQNDPKYGPIGWNRIGKDIDGDTTWSLFGQCVELNADGSTVVIGGSWVSSKKGLVRVYSQDITNTTINPIGWRKIGQDIIGDRIEDYSGSFCAINDAGTILAIGAPENDANSGNATDNRGQTKMFQYYNNEWIQIGQNLEGSVSSARFGGYISLNSSGTIVAIGDNNSTVTVYKLNDPAPTPAPTIGTLTVPAKNFGDAPFNLSAPSSNSEGEFTYTSSNTSVATVTSGGTVIIVGAGSTTITATQAADSNYTSGSVTGTLVVSLISPTIGTLSVPAKNFGDAPFNLSAPSSNSEGEFTYTSSNTSVATVTSGGTVIIVGAGSTTITATQAAAGNYTSGSVTGTLVVSLISPTIGTLSVPSKSAGDATFNLSAPSSNSGGAFTYTSSNTSVATVTSGGTVTIVGVGSTTITATQAAAGNYTSGSVTGTLVVSLISPTIGRLTIPSKFVGEASFNITAPESNSGGAFTYTSSTTNVATVTSGGIVTIVGEGRTIIVATQAAAGNYTSGTVSGTLDVYPLPPAPVQVELPAESVAAIEADVPDIVIEDPQATVVTIPMLANPDILTSGTATERVAKRETFFKEFFTKNANAVSGKTIKMDKEVLLGTSSIISKAELQVVKAVNTETPVDTSNLANDEGIYAFIDNVGDFIVLQMGVGKKLKVEKRNASQYNIYEDYVDSNTPLTTIKNVGDTGEYNGFGYQIGSFTGPIDNSLLPIAICFPCQTHVVTDQGEVHIDKLKVNLHTIQGKRIVSILETAPNFKYIICIEKNALGNNCPSRRTEISPDHRISYNGQMIKAKDLVDVCEGVHLVPFIREKIYNVLMEQYDTIIVNNMVTETLHPDNVLVQIACSKEYTPETKLALCKEYERLLLSN